MDEQLLKLVAIRSGDEITYRGEDGKHRTSTCTGWRSTMREGKWCKQLMLANGAYVLLAHVVSRERRAGSCGSGVIVFEEQRMNT